MVDDERFIARVTESGLPPVEQTFGNFVTDGRNKSVLRMRTMCRHYIYGNKDKWLYLWGFTGSGKSHMAAATLRGLILLGHWPAYWVVTSTMLDSLTPSDFREESMWRVKHAGALVLDEFATDRTNFTDYRATQILELLSHRYDHNLLTIFTSNLPLTDMKDLIDPRVHRRMVDRCCVAAVDDTPYRGETT